jgi:hypothetical protein
MHVSPLPLAGKVTTRCPNGDASLNRRGLLTGAAAHEDLSDEMIVREIGHHVRVAAIFDQDRVTRFRSDRAIAIGGCQLQDMLAHGQFQTQDLDLVG